MKKNVLYLILSLILPAITVMAQDVHFSQYYLSPLSLNPANTGNYQGDYRFFGNYRSQWKEISNAYETFSAGGDFNIFPKNVNLSGGLIFIRDASGGNLQVDKIMPSFAMHRKIAGFKLNAGVQPGIVIETINYYSHSFPDQLNWQTGLFDNGLPTAQSDNGSQFKYFDLNAGASASRRFGNIEPEVGFAAFHLNKPKQSFFGDDNHLPIRQAYTLGLNFYLGKLFIIRAHSVYGYTDRVSDWVSGVNFEYVLSQNVFFTNSVFIGGMWRNGYDRNQDAGIVTAGFNYSHYTVGFSYDVTFSKLKTSVDSKGAYEIAFIYRGKSTRLIKKRIPCERY